MLKNRRLTVKDLTDMIGISEGSVNTILKDHLGLRKVKSHLEKSRHVEVCEAMLSDYQDKRKCIITGDETWMVTTLKQPTNQANIVLKARPD